MSGVADSEEKADLQRYLQTARDALVWKLDGLTEYEIRRPMTPTGTNLLGLIKHLATVEIAYFADTFGRPFGERLQWMIDVGYSGTDALGPDVLVADLWAAADESREEIVGLYRRAWAHSDATIQELDLDSVGHVLWWPPGRQEVTLRRILVHMITETHRHAGHADILRELIDGAAGLSRDNDNLATQDQAWWEQHRAKLERVAAEVGDYSGQ
jgi:uncharacterized damage-inducible protein DinB